MQGRVSALGLKEGMIAGNSCHFITGPRRSFQVGMVLLCCRIAAEAKIVRLLRCFLEHIV